MEKIKKELTSTLNLKEVIEALSIYDVEHCRFPHNYLIEAGYEIPYLRGLVMDDKKLILIDREQGTEEMRETVIHELIHTKYFRIGNLTKHIERVVNAETNRTYEKIYGVKI